MSSALAIISQSIRLSNALGESVVILPKMGGTIQELNLKVNGALQNVIVADKEENLIENPLFRGRLLIPFNDRIPGGKYSFLGTSYSLPINCEDDGSSIHGLLYDKDLEVVSCNSSSAILQYVFQNECSGFPFHLKVLLKYKMEATGFMLHFEFQNLGNITTPLAVGWHPYFSLGGCIDDHKLDLNGKAFVEVDESLLPTGNLPSVSGQEFDFTKAKAIGSQELDLAITAPDDGITRLILDGKKIEIIQDVSFFPYVQMYIPIDRKSIAIEPVSGATNSFNNAKLGRKDLKPAEILTTWFAVRGS
jgi:aldose 1-epimerase